MSFKQWLYESFAVITGNNALLAGLSSDDMEQRDRFFSRGVMCL